MKGTQKRRKRKEYENRLPEKLENPDTERNPRVKSERISLLIEGERFRCQKSKGIVAIFSIAIENGGRQACDSREIRFECEMGCLSRFKRAPLRLLVVRRRVRRTSSLP